MEGCEVERVVGVSGNAVKHKFLEPRSTQNFPYPKLEELAPKGWFFSGSGSTFFRLKS